MGVTHNLVKLLQEYIIELRTDASHKDKDLLYFEIWRLVAKDNVSILLHLVLCNKPLICIVNFTKISEKPHGGHGGSIYNGQVPYTQRTNGCWTKWDCCLDNERNGKMLYCCFASSYWQFMWVYSVKYANILLMCSFLCYFSRLISLCGRVESSQM